MWRSLKLSKLKIKKRKKPLMVKRHQDTTLEGLEKYSGGFKVLICTPVPMYDHKISASLSNFISGCVARQVGLPLTLDSRDPEQARNRAINQFLTNPDFQMHTHILHGVPTIQRAERCSWQENKRCSPSGTL